MTGRDLPRGITPAMAREAAGEAMECVRACSGLGDQRWLQVMASSAPEDTGISLGTLRVLAAIASQAAGDS
jgi:hypothetical protein